MIEEDSENIQIKTKFPSITLFLCNSRDLIYFLSPSVHRSLLPLRPTIINVNPISVPSSFYISSPLPNPKPHDYSFLSSWFTMQGSGRSRRRRGDGCTVVECYTPGRVVSRWLSGLKSSKGKRDTVEEEQEDDDPKGYQLPPIRCSTKRLNETSPETNRFESQSREAPLEMGIGSFLLYLVVASKTELDKMVNLRMQMEMFLLHAKEQLQKKDSQQNPPLSSNEPSCYQFSPQDISNLASSIFQESSTSVLQEENTDCEVSKPEDCHQGTDDKAKLKAEVDMLPLDEIAEDRHTKHQIQRQRKLKENEVTKSHVPEMMTDERYGVCPYELEKKLHELLETRQQEELLKLETALSRVQRRLHEKETEVSWWKDAARLLAQRVPESSRSGLEWCNPESYTDSERSIPRSFKAFSKHRMSFSR